MELERTVYAKLAEWKKTRPENRKAFVLKGPRQSGKTWIIRKFAKLNYESLLEINFHDTPNAASIFSGEINVDKLIVDIVSLNLGTPLIPGKTLLFLDEIQECDRAYSSLKTLAQDKRFDTIASGSMLGLGFNVQAASYPVGYIKETILRPLSFAEFCKAAGLSDIVFNHLAECFEKEEPVNETVHNQLLSLWKTYIVVGGMPDCVSLFLDTRSLSSVVETQLQLHHEYEMDVIKYTGKEERAKAKAIYEKIPSALETGARRFKLSEIDVNARYERYESGFVWLFDSGTVLPCFNVKEPLLPLEVNKERTLQKLYLSDVGMLCAKTLNGNQYVILTGDIPANLGYIWENAIAQELMASGHEKLYYFNKKTIGEIDFLINGKDGVVPVEVKSGKDWRRHNALDKLVSIPNWRIRKAYVVSQGNVEVAGKIVNIPWYMTMFLKPATPEGEVIMSDLQLMEKALSYPRS